MSVSSADQDPAPDHSEHAWLCNGRLLRLDDNVPAASGASLRLFQFAWRHCQPVLLTGLTKRLDADLWRPECFASLPDHGYDPESPETSSAVTGGETLRTFFEGLGAEASSRRSATVGDESSASRGGGGGVLRLRDNWPVGEDQFAELAPAQLKDIVGNLPLRDYTDRDGLLNLGSRLPDSFVRIDLGPRLWGGYARSTYNMQYSVSDCLQWCVYAGADRRDDVADMLTAAKCDVACVERVRETPAAVAALWHVYHPAHADKVKAFILKTFKASDGKSRPKDPLHEQTMYLKDRHIDKLADEEGIRPMVFSQLRGECVAVPAGAPFQVKLVQASLFTQTEFVSPEHMAQAVDIFHSAPIQRYDDRLQVKNLVFHACKDALSVLYDDEEEEEDASAKQDN